MKKLAVITSHPIQYNAPLFRLISQRGNIKLKVFYTWGQTQLGAVYDPDFKKEFTWDIPLLNEYEWEFIHNYSTNPGAGHFSGIVNKDLEERVMLFQPDAVMIYGWSFKSHLKAIRYFKGKIPVIFRGDSTLLDEPAGFHIKKLIRRFFLKWVYRHIDYALYTGKANRDYFLKHGVTDKQLVFGPHAINTEHFKDNDGKFQQMAQRMRAQQGIPDDAFVFLFAGKLEPKKNPMLLIRAFKKIRSNHAFLLIVGNGKLESELKEVAKDDKRILFLDFQNQSMMPVIYRMADVFVLPSAGPGETWGLAVNEAMACGLRCIVSNKCGCAPDLGSLQGNRVFESGNEGQLLEIMSDFISKESEHSIETVYNKYSVGKLAASVESIVCN